MYDKGWCEDQDTGDTETVSIDIFDECEPNGTGIHRRWDTGDGGWIANEAAVWRQESGRFQRRGSASMSQGIKPGQGKPGGGGGGGGGGGADRWRTPNVEYPISTYRSWMDGWMIIGMLEVSEAGCNNDLARRQPIDRQTTATTITQHQQYV